MNFYDGLMTRDEDNNANQYAENLLLEGNQMISEYHAYLLRIWNHSESENVQGFISLEDPKSHNLTYFKTMEELFIFFKGITHSEDHQYKHEEIIENHPESPSLKNQKE